MIFRRPSRSDTRLETDTFRFNIHKIGPKNLSSLDKKIFIGRKSESMKFVKSNALRASPLLLPSPSDVSPVHIQRARTSPSLYLP